MWLLVWTASTTLLVARICWYLRGVWGDLRELNRVDAEQSAEDTQQKQADERAERERRLIEKLDAAGGNDSADKENLDDGD